MTTFALSFDVVIAGGGFAGVACAQQLAKEFGTEGPKRVALISDQNFMVFQPMLAEVVGSSISPRHIVNPIRRLARVTVLRGNITDADLGTRQLTLEAGDFAGTVSVSFQHLVLTLGGVVDLSRVPGMPEHAFLMKNVGDALKLRATIIDRFEEANLESDPAERRRLLTFVIVGGGYSGVETAGQINDLGEEILSFYPRLARDEFRVVLIHSQAHLLPEISEALGRYCEDHLLSRSVELMLNTRVTAMTAGRVLLGDGREIESHTVVSTVGNAPHPLLSRLCKAGAFDCAKGRIICDQTLRVVGQQHLWAAGDCAAVPMPAPTTNSPTDPHTFCPPTAQFATRQGKLLGENIARTLDHAREPKPFTFTGLGELASIGHRAAVADIMGVRFSGFLAWFVWRTIYLSKLPGVERKLRVMIDWTLDLFFPRDITLFQSKPTQLLQEIHLEKGDVVVRSGERAFSLYLVKSGRVELLDAAGAVERSVTTAQHFGTRTLREDRHWRFDAVAAEPTTLVAVSARVFETLEGSGLLEGQSDSATAALTPVTATAPTAPVAALASESAAATSSSETILVNLPPRRRPAPSAPGASPS